MMSPAALRIAEVFAVDLAELIPLSAVPQREMNVFLVPGEDSANEHVPPQRVLTPHNSDSVLCKGVILLLCLRVGSILIKPSCV